jgi:hypothetical protein
MEYNIIRDLDEASLAPLCVIEQSLIVRSLILCVQNVLFIYSSRRIRAL